MGTPRTERQGGQLLRRWGRRGKESSGVVVMVLPGSEARAPSSRGCRGSTPIAPLMDQLQTRLKQVGPALKSSRAGGNGAAFLGGGGSR